jgi:hypothetical protein
MKPKKTFGRKGRGKIKKPFHFYIDLSPAIREELCRLIGSF